MTDTPAAPQPHAAQLPDVPRMDNGTPIGRGVTTQGAAGLIEGLLDGDDHVPGTDNRNREPQDKGQGDGGESGGDDDPDPDGDELPAGEDLDGDDGGDGAPDGDDKKTGDDDADPAQQDSEEQITTLSGLAEALETNPEELAEAISHTFKAAGEERTVTLAELVQGYQLRADYDRSKGELATQRQALDTAQQEGIKAFEAQAAQTATLLNYVEQNILGQYNETEMQNLRQADPSEFAARMYEKDQKLAALNQKRQDAAKQYDDFMARQKQEFLAREGQKLLEEVPDWGREKLDTAVATIKSLGLSDEEVADVADSRMIKAALELTELRAENKALKARMEKATTAAAKVKKTVPKIAKPGKGPRTGQAARVDRSRVQKLKSNLKKSNHVRDAAALIETYI